MGKKLFLGATGLFCFLLPLSTKFANIGIALLMISVVFYLIENRKSGLTKSVSWLSILTQTTAFILVLLTIGLIYTDYFSKAIKYYENFNSYLVLPVLFTFVPKSVLLDSKKVAFRFFLLGAITCSLILLGNNFYTYFMERGFTFDSNLFGPQYTYVRFASLLKLHPTMIGIYLVFALVILNEVKSLFNKNLRIIGSIILGVCLVFMNSRVPFLILGVYLMFKAFLSARFLLQQKR